ncbi:N-acetylmuramoyl-L-alanine amidase [Shimia sp.]|uniref:N-acetylmuramoyl-L-alanine amidase n=1 Tax=Shimia sp. TaxID=1954381 RepID=UPI003BAB2B0C
MKLAIVVGHNARAQGAVRRDTGETEFSWNSRLSEIIEDRAGRFPGMFVKTFFREDVGSYRRELREVYRQVDEWGAEASCELHFNSHSTTSATGTETLTSGTPLSRQFAMAVQREMLDALGLRDRGLKTVSRTDRGGKSLFVGRAPAILIEPFFGSSPKGLAATDEHDEMVFLADAILRGASKVFV